MTETVRLGGLDPSTFLVEDLRLPIQETGAIAMMRDGVDQAAAERKAVAVLGAKGTGKSIALERAKREFQSAEEAKREEDGKYQPRRIVVVHSPRSSRDLEVYSAIWKAAVGSSAPVRKRGRTIPAEELRDRLVEHLLAANVAVLAFEEAESLSYQGLTVIRDLVSVSEATSKERFSGDAYAPAGVGVLLVGAMDLEPRLREWEELGHRLLRIVRLTDLDAEEVAWLYRAFLAGIDRHASAIGDEAWVGWIRQEVTHGKPVPIRGIENHVRAYIRRMAENDPEIEAVDDVEFNEELFLYTLHESPLFERRRESFGE